MCSEKYIPKGDEKTGDSLKYDTLQCGSIYDDWFLIAQLKFTKLFIKFTKIN